MDEVKKEIKSTLDDEQMYSELQPGARAWFDDQTIRVQRSLWMFYIYMAAALIAPGLSFLLKPGADSWASWFQRSGSIIVVVSLLAEIKLNDSHKLAIKENSFLYCNVLMKNRFSSKLKWLNFANFVFIAIGTLIWGYGDKLS